MNKTCTICKQTKLLSEFYAFRSECMECKKTYENDRKIKAAINDYYITILDNIIGELKYSLPGKRMWVESSNPEWAFDYGVTEHSTFPDWIKFWFIPTPKAERLNYVEVGGKQPYEDGYFNGNTKELWPLLKRARNRGFISKKSKRVQVAFDMIVQGYLEEARYNGYEF